MITKRLFFTVLLFSSLLMSVLTPTAMASTTGPFSSVCSQTGASSSVVCTDSKNTSNPISGNNGVLVKITDIIAFVAGAAAVILIIIGGLRYITSAGDPEKAKSARSTVINALIGLVVIALAASLITYVVEKL